LVIVNPKDISDNWNDKLISNTDWNAYEDFPAIFPEEVFNLGELIY